MGNRRILLHHLLYKHAFREHGAIKGPILGIKEYVDANPPWGWNGPSPSKTNWVKYIQ